MEGSNNEMKRGSISIAGHVGKPNKAADEREKTHGKRVDDATE